MKTKLLTAFVASFATVILLCTTIFAAEINVDVTDRAAWEPIESTLDQEQKDGGWPMVDGTNCIGWLKGGNVIEILEKVDFGDGLTDVKTTFSSDQEAGTLLTKYPNVKLVIHIDSATGPVIAELNPDSAGKDMWTQSVEPAKTVITDAGKACKGLHSVFLERKNDEAAKEPGFNIWPITFIVTESKQVVASQANSPANTSTSSLNPSASATSTASSASKSPVKTTSANPSSTIKNSTSKNDDNKNSLLVPLIIGGFVVIAAVTAFIAFKKRSSK